jgi:hypothetical protein
LLAETSSQQSVSTASLPNGFSNAASSGRFLQQRGCASVMLAPSETPFAAISGSLLPYRDVLDKVMKILTLVICGDSGCETHENQLRTAVLRLTSIDICSICVPFRLLAHISPSRMSHFQQLGIVR